MHGSFCNVRRVLRPHATGRRPKPSLDANHLDKLVRCNRMVTVVARAMLEVVAALSLVHGVGGMGAW